MFDLYKREEQTIYFGELYRRYIPMVYGVCLKYLANEADAQDAVMDLYEDLNQRMLKYAITSFHSWLYTVTKNHCLLKIRKEKQVHFVDLNEAIMENGDFFTLSDREQSAEQASALSYCLKELSSEQRTSIDFFYYENKSYADIVTITGYSLEKVKSYIQNGKRNLKNCINRMLEVKAFR
ncbi:MAG: sigma-70 family RNA polymerase sigma factor [Bacteroidales bacterium]|nr:sigma-70 family RNA polymerase sigma factor [Bacteroidales bacterium]